jgi:hypothetical protein
MGREVEVVEGKEEVADPIVQDLQDRAVEANIRLINLAKERLVLQDEGNIEAIRAQGDEVVQVLQEVPVEVLPIMIADLVIALAETGRILAEMRDALVETAGQGDL